MLESWLPEAILNKIACIHPPCGDAGSEMRVSFGEDIDGFSVGRAYRYLMQYDRDHADARTKWALVALCAAFAETWKKTQYMF
ncbi:hypothetical protein KIW84_062262 [Lathyrus oleraceus]|uniref:Uncharacterized protein n=1 Tax=Pisum sativum TaxID=3888 RepID=A0A9D5A677_PEA|nr:hypothetical protein KIW84_062262 [Pisum sativum]